MEGNSGRATEALVRSPRSVGFPAVSLPDAAAIMKLAASNGRHHSLTAMAAYLGHATANSGPFRQKLAALKDWGLVAMLGDAVTITDRGMGIALPASPAAELDLMLGAFQGCSIFWEVYNDTAKGLPLSLETIGNNAVTLYGVNAKTRDKFVKSFVDSAAAVGMAERLPTGEVRLMQHAVEADAVRSRLPTPPIPETPVLTGGSEKERGTSRPASEKRESDDLHTAISQVWKDGTTEIVFEVRASGPLPSAAFMEIGTAVTAIEVLREALQDSQS